MDPHEKLLPYYDYLLDNADLKFQGMLLNPQHEYDSKLSMIKDRLAPKLDPALPLERPQLARLYYWLTQKFQRMQKSQREVMPDKYKSPEYKQYEKWEREYDPARHSIYTAKKLSQQDVEERGLQLPK